MDKEKIEKVINCPVDKLIEIKYIKDGNRWAKKELITVDGINIWINWNIAELNDKKILVENEINNKVINDRNIVKKIILSKKPEEFTSMVEKIERYYIFCDSIEYVLKPIIKKNKITYKKNIIDITLPKKKYEFQIIKQTVCRQEEFIYAINNWWKIDWNDIDLKEHNEKINNIINSFGTQIEIEYK